MKAALKFQKAKLHFYNSKYNTIKITPQNDLNRFCSQEPQQKKSCFLRIRTQKSPQSDGNFSDSKVRLSVWNFTSKCISPKDALSQKSKQKIVSKQIEINKASPFSISNSLKKKKLKKGQQLYARTPSKNINQIQVKKIEPQTEIREKPILKIDKSPILQYNPQSKRSLCPIVQKKYKDFRHSLANFSLLQSEKSDKFYLKNLNQLQYTLNLSLIREKNIKSIIHGKKIFITSNPPESLEAWTNREQNNEDMSMDFISIRRIREEPNCKSFRKKVVKSQQS